jgi:beta-lysine 5,6-aminomutase alpha subunit
MSKLGLSLEQIAQAREEAKKVAIHTQEFIDKHTTDSVERTIVRLLGVDGTNAFDVPTANLVVDFLKDHHDPSIGVAQMLAFYMQKNQASLEEIVEQIKEESLPPQSIETLSKDEVKKSLLPYYEKQLKQIKEQAKTRKHMKEMHVLDRPMLYVIVATGNIYEDVTQAKAAAKQGADVIAVIRTTGQSLLDYVPYGPTTEGFGGTYATQENFKIMREALDQVSKEENRYIHLVNYASGLCMPEIAAMGALERLDMMLNDSLYGILFRDINMERTFVDQYFSRVISAYASITINTGEDNYLTTSDALHEAHTVLASQFINEQFALHARMPEELMGLGHAFEIDPSVEDGFLYEYAQALMAREIFPKAPLKYMPPTKHMTGNVFKGYAQNTLFNIVTSSTNQSIHLLGMLTEAVHTPFMSDRYLAIENAKMINQTMKHFGEEITFKKDGKIQRRAQAVLKDAHELIKEINKDGLFDSLSKGVFAGIKRTKDGGKGRHGVYPKAEEYTNPIIDDMLASLKEVV